MHDERWWIWGALIFVVIAFNALRGAIRAARAGGGGMARLNAAAERILKERGISVANPLPRTTPQKRNPTAATAKPRASPAVMKAGAIPAVVRRGSLLAGKEPVIQRRRSRSRRNPPRVTLPPRET